MLIVTVYLAAAGFHVYRYHYRNDASIPVFVLACLFFLIITIFIFAQFSWNDGRSSSSNQTINNTL